MNNNIFVNVLVLKFDMSTVNDELVTSDKLTSESTSKIITTLLTSQQTTKNVVFDQTSKIYIPLKMHSKLQAVILE